MSQALMRRNSSKTTNRVTVFPWWNAVYRWRVGNAGDTITVVIISELPVYVQNQISAVAPFHAHVKPYIMNLQN